MERSNRKSMLVGLAGGAGAAMCIALLMGQGGTGSMQEYFVTGEGSRAYLWQREGSSIRFISQGEKAGKPAETPRPTDPIKPKDPPKP